MYGLINKPNFPHMSYIAEQYDWVNVFQNCTDITELFYE